MKAEVMVVTPEQATSWLEKNTKNRPKRESLVSTYASDMKNKAWRSSGEAIKFDINGVLIDGQHRLSAIVQAGTPIEMLIVTELDPGVMEVIDTGRKRTPGDILAITRGTKSPMVVASMTRFDLLIRRNAFKNSTMTSGESAIRGAITVSQIIDHLDHLGEKSVERAAMDSSNYYAVFPSSPTALALARYYTRKRNATASDEFFYAICNAATDGPGDPRLACIQRIQSMRNSGLKLFTAQHYAVLIKAWNAWRKGQEVTRLLPDKIPVTVAQ